MSLRRIECPKCGHSWNPRVKRPVKCPRCGYRLEEKDLIEAITKRMLKEELQDIMIGARSFANKGKAGFSRTSAEADKRLIVLTNIVFKLHEKELRAFFPDFDGLQMEFKKLKERVDEIAMEDAKLRRATKTKREE